MRRNDLGLRLLPEVHAYLDRLVGSPFKLSENEGSAIESLSEWMKRRIEKTGAASVMVVCVGNSRRSVMAAAIGNAAAAYFALPARFYSGGSEPSAVNARALRALQEVGFRIVPTGRAAASGVGGEENLVYQIRWADAVSMPDEISGHEEFSKTCEDDANPRGGFAAILVCEAQGHRCPLLRGADLLLSIPFDDPKDLDGTPEETLVYAKRRDEIGHVIVEILERVAHA